MSKYHPIHDFLRYKNGPVEVSFSSLADLGDGGLPASAYRYGAWWASVPTLVQSTSWVSACHRAEPDLSSRSVRFVPR